MNAPQALPCSLSLHLPRSLSPPPPPSPSLPSPRPRPHPHPRLVSVIQGDPQVHEIHVCALPSLGRRLLRGYWSCVPRPQGVAGHGAVHGALQVPRVFRAIPPPPPPLSGAAAPKLPHRCGCVGSWALAAPNPSAPRGSQQSRGNARPPPPPPSHKDSARGLQRRNVADMDGNRREIARPRGLALGSPGDWSGWWIGS